MTETNSERRRTQRVDYRVPCRVRFDGQEFSGESINVSLRGALATLDGSIPDSTTCALELCALGEHVFEVAAEAVHTEGDSTGFRFQSMELDALTHLRQVVRYNADHELDTYSELEGFLCAGDGETDSLKGAES